MTNILQQVEDALGDITLSEAASKLLALFDRPYDISELTDYTSTAAMKCRATPEALQNINSIYHSILQLVTSALEEADSNGKAINQLSKKCEKGGELIHDLEELESTLSMTLALCETGNQNLFKNRIGKDINVAFKQDCDEKLKAIATEFEDWSSKIEQILSHGAPLNDATRNYLEAAHNITQRAVHYVENAQIPLGIQTAIMR